MRTNVIVEPGSTHEGDYDKVCELIDLAADIGADAFKNQWVSDPEALARRRGADDIAGAYADIAYPVEWHKAFSLRCHNAGLSYGCSVYLPSDVGLLMWNAMPDFFKVSSFEVRDAGLLAILDSNCASVIASTGMTTIADLATLKALRRLNLVGLLHCVSAYPCPDDAANIWGMLPLSEAFPRVRIGYSDHTTSPLTGALAVACGADMVEFHVRLRDTPEDNPDYGHSRSPGWAKVYVANIREAELLCGDGLKRPKPVEAEMQRYIVGKESR